MSQTPPRTAWRRSHWLVLALIYWVTVSLAHLPFSLWLLRQRQSPWGPFAFVDALPGLIVAAGLVLVAWITRNIARHPRPLLVSTTWLAWLACVAAVDRTLTYSLPEYFHYPQYALLALLLARLIDPDRRRYTPGRIIFWTTLLGGLDELAQYLWTTAHYSAYLDFNDLLTNLLAAIAGTLLHYGKPGSPAYASPMPPRLEALTLGGLVLVAATALATGRLAITPPPGANVPPGGILQADDSPVRAYLQRKHPGAYASYNAGPYRGRYWILDPTTALLMMSGAGVGFAASIRRSRPDH